MAGAVEHSWDVTPRQAAALQVELAGLVSQRPLAVEVRTVAGVDCAFMEGGKRIVAACVLMDARTMEVVAEASAVGEVKFPYVPGLLTFREAPTELAAIEKLPQRPSLLMVDGAGVAHPRRLGIASHVGLWLDIPTIGVAKSRLCGLHRAVGRRRGSAVQLRDGEEVIGAVLRTQDEVRPLYVSVGHRITLRESLKWVLRFARRYRLPEPVRAADQLAGRLKLEMR